MMETKTQRRHRFEAERIERERRAAMTLDDADDAATYLAGLIAAIDLEALRCNRGRYSERTPEELSRLRACALAALWRLPLTKGEYTAYPYAGGCVSPGLRSLSHAVTFQQAVGTWAPAKWDGARQVDRSVFVSAEYQRRRVGYAYTPEQLGRKATQAARIARRWRLIDVQSA